MGRRATFQAVLGLLTLSGFAWARPPPRDPNPSVTWQDLRRLPLAVVARARPTGPRQLTLTIDRVLRGPQDVKDHPLRFATRGWFRIKEQQLRYRRADRSRLSDHVLLRDLAQPNLYLFFSVDRPVLQRYGQVQSPEFLDDWIRTLAGREPSTRFLLVQDLDIDKWIQGLERLAKDRDPALLDRLVAAMSDTDSPFHEIASRILSVIGDRGDVVPRMKRLVAERDRPQTAALAVIGATRAQGAFRLLRRLCGSQDRGLRRSALWALGSLRTDASQRHLFRLARKGRRGDRALSAATQILHRSHSDWGRRTEAAIARLQEEAVTSMRRLAADPAAPDSVRSTCATLVARLQPEPPAPDEVLDPIRSPRDLESVPHHHSLPTLLRHIEATEPMLAEIDAHILHLSRFRSSEIARLLRIRLALCPHTGAAVLRRVLRVRARQHPWMRANLLALAVHHGEPGYGDELLCTVRALGAGSRNPADSFSPLLLAGSEAALHLYEERLGGAVEETSHRTAVDFLRRLWPDHKPLFFRWVLRLGSADTFHRRSIGAAAAEDALGWPLDIQRYAFSHERKRWKRRMAPVFERFSELDTKSCHESLLRLLGMKPLPRYEGRMAALRRLAAHPNRGVRASANALLQEYE